MKYDITPDDLKTMEHDMRNDRTLKHIRNLSFYKFTVGDVLIREERYHKRDSDGFEWKTKLAECGIPNKYVYVFENELGVGYIRRLSINGRKFVDKPLCVTEFDPDQTRFGLDPEYADHMIFNDEKAEFDAKSRYDEIKKKREQIHRKNKKVALQFADETAVVAWMNTLKVGDQLWYGYSISSIGKEPYFVHEINTQAPPSTTPKVQGNPFNYGYRQEQFSPHIKVSTQQPGTPGGYASSLNASHFVRYYVFLSRPTFVDEIIN